MSGSARRMPFWQLGWRNLWRDVRSGELGPHEHLAAAVAQWQALDPQEFPFVHHIIDEFAGHDDTDQFRAGLDLLLAGLRLQAES